MPNATMRANAQAMPINRRAAVSGLAAFGALLAAPRAARASGKTSCVYSAYVAFTEAWDASCVAARISEEIKDRCGTPDRPEFIDGADCGYRITAPEMGKRAVIDVSDENVDTLRHRLSALKRLDADVSEWIGLIEATLEKIEAFHTECERRRDDFGVPQAEAAYGEAYERACSAADAVLAVEAKSVTDLAMQADVAMKWGRDGDTRDVLKHLIAFAGLDNRADPLARAPLARSPAAI